MNYLSTLIFFLFIFQGVFAQESIELISERTLYSKTFLNSDGSKEQIISPQLIHYELDGALFPIDLNLEMETERFLNMENVLQSSFPSLLENGSMVELIYNNASISIGGVKQLVKYSELAGVEIIDLTFNSSEGVVSAESITYEDIYHEIDDKYTILNGGVKNEFILRSLPNLLVTASEGYFGFQERIVLPEGWSLEPTVVQESDLIQGEIKILDANDICVLTIPAPVFYDSQGTNDGVSMVQGGFLIDKDVNGWLLSTILPINWLKAPTTSYPIVIDPTVVLGGADGGWQSQNNYVNNPGYVFIGVCCGNLEHRGWLQFNTTSINDAACITNVELEVNVSGIGGAASELVHAYDMTGAFGPYGGVIPAVYTDMGNGYYTSFSIAGTGTYGYYDLGASAVWLLQTQLVTMNAFQVSLIFDNEPSTNWKRMSAGLCNLRVTYDDPPCVLLPVGMMNFDVQCVSDQANLSWSTATESNSSHFTIWKSNDGINFSEEAKVQSGENSVDQLDYRWIDAELNTHATYYKLSQTDMDGYTEDFEPRFFNPCEKDDPVIFSDELSRIHVRMQGINGVTIIDNLGRSVLTELEKGDSNEIIIDDNSLIPGIYSVTVKYGLGNQRKIKYYIR